MFIFIPLTLLLSPFYITFFRPWYPLYVPQPFSLPTSFRHSWSLSSNSFPFSISLTPSIAFPIPDNLQFLSYYFRLAPGALAPSLAPLLYFLILFYPLRTNSFHFFSIPLLFSPTWRPSSILNSFQSSLILHLPNPFLPRSISLLIPPFYFLPPSLTLFKSSLIPYLPTPFLHLALSPHFPNSFQSSYINYLSILFFSPVLSPPPLISLLTSSPILHTLYILPNHP